VRKRRQNRLRRDFLKYDLKYIAQNICARTIKKIKRIVLIIRKESFLRTVQVMLKREVPATGTKAIKIISKTPR